MIPYFNSIKDYDNNITFSIDMIKITGLVSHGHKDIIGKYLSKRGELLGWRQPYPCTTPLRAHYMLHMQYDEHSSVQLMLGINTFKGTISDDIYIIFNPNKVLDRTFNHNWIEAYKDLYFLLDNIKSCSVKSFDIAIDIPVKREDVTVLPAWGRRYARYNGNSVVGVEDGIDIVNADDYTQYVGRHNHHGFVKVYNKRIEANLKTDMTRVEYTIELEAHREDYRYTPVFYMPSHQITLPDVYDNELYKNFMLLANKLQVVSEVIPMFESRKIKENIKKMVLHDFVDLDFSHNECFKSLFGNIGMYYDKNTYKITDNYTYRDADEYYLLYSRRQYLKKFRYYDNGHWIYCVDISYEDMLRMSDKEFNEAVLFFCKLHNQPTDNIIPFEFKRNKDIEYVSYEDKHNDDVSWALSVFWNNPFVHSDGNEKAFIKEFEFSLFFFCGDKIKALDNIAPYFKPVDETISFSYDNCENITEKT